MNFRNIYIFKTVTFSGTNSNRFSGSVGVSRLAFSADGGGLYLPRPGRLLKRTLAEDTCQEGSGEPSTPGRCKDELEGQFSTSVISICLDLQFVL